MIFVSFLSGTLEDVVLHNYIMHEILCITRCYIDIAKANVKVSIMIKCEHVMFYECSLTTHSGQRTNMTTSHINISRYIDNPHGPRTLVSSRVPSQSRSAVI